MTNLRVLSANSLEPGSKNILGFQAPELCRCGIVKYQRSHSVMVVRCNMMQSNSQILNISFDGVTYFSGPMSWSGASFNVGKISQHLDLLMSYNKSFYDNVDPSGFDYTILSERLLVVDSDRITIQIIANAITVQEINEV